MSGPLNPEQPPDAQPDQAPAVQGGQLQVPPPPAWFQQFLNNQSKELEIRLKQTEIEGTREQHTFEYSNAALAAQSEYLNNFQNHYTRRFNRLWIFVTVIIFLVLFFLGAVILSGNGQIAIELVKAVVYVGAGGVGGYGIAQRKKDVQQQQQQQQR